MDAAPHPDSNPDLNVSPDPDLKLDADAIATSTDAFEDLDAAEHATPTAAFDATDIQPKPDAPANPEAYAHLPVPIGKPVQQQRTSLWKRIGLRRGNDGVTNEALRSRLDGITLRLESIERALAQNEERLEERLTRLWEVEEQLEQLSDLSERTTEARDAAQEAAASTASLGRTVNFVALLIVLAIAGGAAAFALLLLAS